MKKTKFLESKILICRAWAFHCRQCLWSFKPFVTPTDYACCVFSSAGLTVTAMLKFTNHESVYNLTREGEFCANLEFFAKSETGLVPITALNRLHNGDSLTVIPVYDSVYTELLKVKPDASPLTLKVEGLPAGLTRSGSAPGGSESRDSTGSDAAFYRAAKLDYGCLARG